MTWLYVILPLHVWGEGFFSFLVEERYLISLQDNIPTITKNMKTTSEIISALREYKALTAEKYGIAVLGLLGSVARGEQREDSDIDVFIKLENPSFFIRMKIQDELEKLFRTKVDVISLHEAMRASLRYNIEQDAIYI